MYYIINKVLFNKEIDLINKQITVNILNICKKKKEAINYIKNLKTIEIFSEEINIYPEIKKKPLTNKDTDGYHLIIDDKNIHKYNIYYKNTSVDKGYIYNSINININYIGFIEINIVNYKNIKKLSLNNDNKTTNTEHIENTEDVTNTENTISKYKKNDYNNYIELNDKLIKELKQKLELLSVNNIQ